MLAVKMKHIDFPRYGRCIELSNGIIRLIATLDFGPRIIHLSIIGSENEFYENDQLTIPIAYGECKLRGGHRLWHSPEQNPRTYMPDNEPVEWSYIRKGVTLSQKIDPWVQVKKEIDISLEDSSNRVRVTHRLINRNAWPIELAIWAITMMAPGGLAIIPFPGKDCGLLPNRLLSLWPYTKMNDPRLRWGEKFITLQQNPLIKHPLKVGVSNDWGWAAYVNRKNVFIKRFSYKYDSKYPDRGVSCETYANQHMLEMESLSPLVLLNPDASLEHTEEWEVINNVEERLNNECEIDEFFQGISSDFA